MATRGGGVPAVPSIVVCVVLFFVAITIVACSLPTDTGSIDTPAGISYTCTGGGTTRTEGGKTITTVCAEQLKSITTNITTLASVTYKSTGLSTGLVADSPVKYISGDYELGGNIDLSGESDFVGIGSLLVPFAGTFDGKGYIVKLAINTTQDYVGLFGYVGISRDNVAAGNQAAVDTLNATIAIENIGTIGTVTSTDSSVGGLIGFMNGGEVKGYSEADIIGESYVGGLIGSQNGGSSIGYATGKVIAINTINFSAGFAGFISAGATATGYSTGVLTATATNGFIGALTGTVNGGYFDKAKATKADSGTGITEVSAAANIYKYTGATETSGRTNGKFYDSKGTTATTDDVLIFDHATFIANFDLDNTTDGNFPKLK